ncbi:NUDIX hydrolase [Permianibacter aggregans]|uniref:8-oxo-dGTP pyrophosphatase MutT (NUDIX family) n=1 Tax=Permianibacter aggregans TaxID=1510150 RepID=A0A4R6UVN3_9GAMM|nr:NUDIX domain-containing protein [Permianibacter aggregans]QGX40359.1 NUDIX domain-containing protein [Permianibacter aggregans]TDQ49515.1 8-oxo-dGTP pyrophosphatase MutT (NUDIX family) [Permianibacter aggregans]
MPELPSADESVLLVDAWNRPIGDCSRRIMRRHMLRHRATYVLVIDSQQRLCVQKRSGQKDYCPGWWDLAAGGVVNVGESYRLSAERELQEELGISAPIQFLREFFTFGEDGGRAFGQVFVCPWQGDIHRQAEEIDAVEWWTAADVSRQRASITPDSWLAWQIYRQQPPSVSVSVGQRLQCQQQLWQIQAMFTDLQGESMAVLSDSKGRCETIAVTTLQAICRDGDTLMPMFATVT